MGRYLSDYSSLIMSEMEDTFRKREHSEVGISGDNFIQPQAEILGDFPGLPGSAEQSDPQTPGFSNG